ncbi:MAG: transglycosylase domain-containing protein [Tannerellaceae bacterium]|jgi:hypothetical protein|nr:transglycosylase domain-containing protein [Tannerellaceae bacterium]
MSKRKSSRRRKKKYITIGIVTLLIMVCLWLAVSIVARQYATQKLQAIEKQYKLNINYRSVSLKDFNSLRIDDLTLAPAHSALVLHARSFVIKANLWKSSFTQEDIEGFEIDELQVSFTQKAKRAAGMPDYASSIGLLSEKLASLSPYLPPYVLIRNMQLAYRDKENKEWTYDVPLLRLSGDRFVAEMQQTGVDKQATRWICKGLYQENPFKISLRLYAQEKEAISLPFVGDYANASVRFDTLAIDLQARKNSQGIQLLQGKAEVRGLSLYHASLSTDTLHLGKAYMNYRLLVGKNFLEMDSSATTIRYKRLQFSPFVRVEKNEQWRLKLALDKKNFPANDLFASLPKGFFRNLDGLKVAGTLSYHLLFDVDMAKVPELVFESSLQPRNFSILKYGNTDLRKMSNPFVHTIYYKGKVARSFEVGSRNPNFRPMHALPRYLPTVIMHGEDFAFYKHKGFYPEAFHKSLVENIEGRDFRRGASTLSMQTVKNVFLNQDKTLARKLEEILIVWLIEENRLTSKSRMLEVYMNIIEWGPNVYGITEAARFYFSKEPSALTFSECLFLAYIIPYPRYIRSHFSGLRLKYPFHEFFHDAVRRLAQRNFISQEAAARANPELVFRGQVIEYLLR